MALNHCVRAYKTYNVTKTLPTVLNSNSMCVALGSRGIERTNKPMRLYFEYIAEKLLECRTEYADLAEYNREDTRQ